MRHIITVTLNPAIDITAELDCLRLNDINRSSHASMRPAGKGINVAAVLAKLGASIEVSGFLGNANDQAFTRYFSELGLTDSFVRIAGQTRHNIKLLHDEQQVTELNLPSFLVEPSAQQALLATLEQRANGNCLVVIAGSLPSGIGPEYLSELITRLKRRGATIYVDTSGPALSAALQSEADLIKPNLAELAEATGKPVSLDTVNSLVDQRDVKGEQSLVVSAGRAGFYSLGPLGQYHCQPPAVKPLSTVGAGDSLLAGLAWGWLQQWPIEKTLVHACALSAWSVTQHGVEPPAQQQLVRLVEQVQIRRLEP